MTFEEILSILQSGKTLYQIAADLHALFETQPEAAPKRPANWSAKARKQRTVTTKPKTPASDAVNGFAGHVDNEGGVQ